MTVFFDSPEDQAHIALVFPGVSANFSILRFCIDYKQGVSFQKIGMEGVIWQTKAIVGHPLRKGTAKGYFFHFLGIQAVGAKKTCINQKTGSIISQIHVGNFPAFIAGEMQLF